LASFPVVLIEGARATGKTTTASRLATTEFRLPRDAALLASDPEGVLSSAEGTVLIDEWQLAGTDLLWVIKSLVDADPTPGRFILTGSVSPESYGPTYPLTGRGTRLRLTPMTQRELTGGGAGPTWLATLIDGLATKPGHAHPKLDLTTLATSGFPAAAKAADSADWLRAYAATVAERETGERHDPVRVMRLLRVLAATEGQAVPDETIWSAADINRVTFVRYHQMLERTHILGDLPSWETNRLKRITTYPKRCFADAALALALARLTPAALTQDPALAGHYLESFVAAQLRPECDAIGATLHHLRTQGQQQEIDFVIETEEGLIALEVKAGVNPTPRDARHLLWFKEKLGSRVLHSVVLHRGEASFELAEGVWALPITSMWT
jgi:predicted AAA+ superfamily ATPase